MEFLEKEILKTAVRNFLIDYDFSFYEKNDNFYVNSPFYEDKKFRLGIKVSDDRGDLKIIYNDFKARAIFFDEKYYGFFWDFLRIFLKFNTQEEAKFYFYNKYIIPLLEENRENKNIFQSLFLKSEFSDLLTKNKKNEFKKLEKKEEKENNYFYYLLSLGLKELSLDKEDLNQKEVIDYLVKRKINLNILKKMKIYYLNNPELENKKINKRIYFPIYNLTNELVLLNGRDFSNSSEIRWFKILLKKEEDNFNIFNLNNNFNTIFVFEGIFDALLFENGISIMGSFVNENFKKIIEIKNFKILYLCYDNDKAGFSAFKKTYDLFKNNNKIKLKFFNWAIFKNKFKDFSEMPLSLINEIKNNREKYFLDSYFEFILFNKLNTI